MALFQKQDSCFSSKAATACGCPAESLRLPTRLRSRRGRSAEINVRFAPPIMCRLTLYRNSAYLIYFYKYISYASFLYILSPSFFKIALKHNAHLKSTNAYCPKVSSDKHKSGGSHLHNSFNILVVVAKVDFSPIETGKSSTSSASISSFVKYKASFCVRQYNTLFLKEFSFPSLSKSLAVKT